MMLHDWSECWIFSVTFGVQPGGEVELGLRRGSNMVWPHGTVSEKAGVGIIFSALLDKWRAIVQCLMIKWEKSRLC